MGPSILLLDLDNTVYPYAPAHRAGLEAAFVVAARFEDAWAERDRFVGAYNAARDEVKAAAGPTAASHCRLLYFKAMCEARGAGVPAEEAFVLDAAYWRGYFAAMKPDPDCRAVLGRLRREGLRLAFVTNFTTRRQIEKLQALGLGDAVDLLVTSEEAGAEKPDPAPLLLALRRFGTRADASTWVVGDSLVEDGAAAESCGLPFLWMRPADAPLPARPPERIARSWAELLRWVRG